MNGEMISIGLVGCGMIGRVHAAEYQKHRDRIDLHVFDINRQAAGKTKEDFEASGIFESLDDVLSSDVDALDICLPHHLHLQMTLSALENGKHVFLEKPIANSLDEADRMIDAAEKNGRILAVCENFRYEPAIARSLEIMKRGDIGRPFLVNIHELSFAIEITSAMKAYEWRMKKSTGGGGVLFDRGVHLMAAANQLGGPVKRVFARTMRPDSKWEVDETSVVMLDHVDSITTNIIESWNIRNPKKVPFLSVFGSRGSIIENPEMRLPGHRQFEIGGIEVYSEIREEFQEKPPEDVVRGVKEYMKTMDDDDIPWKAIEKTFSKGKLLDITTDFSGYNVYEEAILDFIASIREGRSPRVSGLDARSDIELVFAAYRSAETGNPVDLPLTR